MATTRMKKYSHAAYRDCREKSLCCMCRQRRTSQGEARCKTCQLIVRMNRLGLSDEEKELAIEAVRSFDGTCDCCGADNPGKGYTQWHLDHDHQTGCFRGILCAACNHLLGHAKDSPAILKRAIFYLTVGSRV